MSRLIISGCYKLKGDLRVDGSKNAVLPILAASILNGGINVIRNCPLLSDVEIMLEMLRALGCNIAFDSGVAIVDSRNITSTIVYEELASELRSSIFILGPMLARFKKVTISYPGG